MTRVMYHTEGDNGKKACTQEHKWDRAVACQQSGQYLSVHLLDVGTSVICLTN